MKTNLMKLLLSFLFVGGMIAAKPAQAERTIGWSLLGGDTFKLGAVNVAERWDAATSANVFMPDYSAIRNLSVGSPIVGTMPEQRDFDFNFTQTQIQEMNSATPNPRQWRGSSSLIVADGGAGDGYVELAELTTGNHGAYINVLDHPAMGSNFILEADVRSPGAGSVAKIGMLNDGNLLGTENFNSDSVAPIWIRFEEFVTTTSNDFDHFGNRYTGQQVAMICLWSGDLREDFFYLPLNVMPNEPVPSELQAALAAYNAGDFNRIWLEWLEGSNAINLKVNGQEIPFLTGFELSEDIDADDFRAMGFLLSGGASLDRFAVTPEPSSMLMMCFGMLFFGLNNRRQRRRARKLGTVGLSLAG